MILCLYKKFVRRTKGMVYTENNFVEAVVAVGQLALETLLSDDPRLKRSEVIEKVGKYAFDYGLLIGNDDFGLLFARAVDIFVTFPHRTVQEFLGALFLVKMLDVGRKIEDLLRRSTRRAPIYLVNPLFLHFCVWLVYSDQTDFKFQNKENIRLSLAKHAAQHISSYLNMLNIEGKLPAFDIGNAHDRKDRLGLMFFRDVLNNCEKMKVLVLDSKDHLDWFLTSVEPVIHNMSSVCVPRLLDMNFVQGNETIVTLRQVNESLFRSVMAHCKYITDASVNVKIEVGKKRKVDLSIFMQENFKALRIIGKKSLIETDCVPSCLSLTTLSIEKFTVKQNELNALSDAVCHQYLPCVEDISFIECKGLKNKLKLLFQTQWKSLKSLNLYGCLIRVDDLKAIVRMVTLQAAQGQAQVPLLPNLTSLTLSIADLCPNQRMDGVEEIFESNIWKQLTVLKLDTKVSELKDYEGDGYFMFEQALNKGKLCNLATVGINRAFLLKAYRRP